MHGIIDMRRFDMKKAFAVLVFLCMSVCFAREYITAEKTYIERVKVGDKYILMCEFTFTKDLDSKDISCNTVLSIYEGAKLLHKTASVSKTDLSEAAAFLEKMSVIAETLKEPNCLIASRTESNALSARLFYADKELLFYIGNQNSRIKIKEIDCIKYFADAFESMVGLYDKHQKEFSALSF